jgi:hypothetical protein
MKTFAECKAVLDRTRYGKRKRIGVKTWAKYVGSNTQVAIVYNNAYILSHHRDGSFTLWLDYYPGVADRKRVAMYSNAKVYKRKGLLLVDYMGKTYRYKHAMTCYPNGEVTLAQEVA